jgi:hypothetical protein
MAAILNEMNAAQSAQQSQQVAQQQQGPAPQPIVNGVPYQPNALEVLQRHIADGIKKTDGKFYFRTDEGTGHGLKKN